MTDWKDPYPDQAGDAWAKQKAWEREQHKYEWAAVSDFLNDQGQAIIPWEDGWECIGGALRRLKKEFQNDQNL